MSYVGRTGSILSVPQEWATDRTRLTWANSALPGGISHTDYPDFPHCCLCNHSQEHLFRATCGILGTHTAG